MTGLPYFAVESGAWQPGRVYRVADENGRPVAESSDPNDDFMLDAIKRGGTLLRRYHFEPSTPERWAAADLPEPWSPRARKRETEPSPAPQRPHTFDCICPHIYLLNHTTGRHEYRETLRIDACLAHDEGTTE